MRELRRDRQANSSFLYRRQIYPYIYTYMSEEGKRWIVLFFFSYFLSYTTNTKQLLKKKDEINVWVTVRDQSKL